MVRMHMVRVRVVRMRVLHMHVVRVRMVHVRVVFVCMVRVRVVRAHVVRIRRARRCARAQKRTRGHAWKPALVFARYGPVSLQVAMPSQPFGYNQVWSCICGHRRPWLVSTTASIAQW